MLSVEDEPIVVTISESKPWLRLMEDSSTPRRQSWMPVLGVIASTVTMLATLVLAGIAVRDLVPTLIQISETAEGIRLQEKIMIVTPPQGGVVPAVAFASGISPFREKMNYLIVAPVTGGKWVQEGSPLSVGLDGFWSSSVRFGEPRLGCGEEFQLLLLATGERLQAGTINELPRDAILSRPVTVRRAPCPDN